jgi:hypothetical protein
MRSGKGWYWLTAGVLALGLNGAYRDGQLGPVRGLVDRAGLAAERASDGAFRWVARAEMMFGSSPQTLARTEATLHRIQGKLVCERVAMAQRQMAMAQVRQHLAEAQIQRKMDLVQMKMNKVRAITINGANRLGECPGFPRVVVGIPDVPKIDLSGVPDIQVPDLSDVAPDRQHDPI